MTQQYLAGELSFLLGQLQAVTPGQVSARQVARLRYEAETRPLTTLPSVALRALLLTDDLCWESLRRGDTVVFSRQAALSGELYEFGMCARLLDEE
jgi:hypothetical protein